MDTKEKFRSVLEEYKKTLKNYEEVISEFEKDDNVRENEHLKKELGKYKEQFNSMKEDYDKIKKSNAELRMMLHEQMISEKIDILNASREKMAIYFKNNAAAADNRLSELEKAVKDKYAEVNNFIQSREADIDEKFKLRINNIYDEAKEKIREIREKAKNDFSMQQNVYDETSENLRNEEIDKEAMKRKIRNNNIEMKIGLNIVNKIGIILILLSIASGFTYVHKNWLDNYGKGTVAFLIGILFLGVGEFFYRKNKKVFATGLLGGGVAILYYSIFYSYFGLRIVDLNMAFVLSLLVTAITTILSLRYNSKVICGMALVGGYFPFVSYVSQFSLNEQGAYISMGYLFILNITIIAISLYKRWSGVKYISFLLNVPSMLYLMNIVDDVTVNMVYATLTFGMYAFITVGYAIKNEVEFEKYDIILLGLNTTISSLAIYNIFEKQGFTDFRGALAIIFCIIYIYLAKLVSDRVKTDKYVSGLFYLTALTFAVLVIPFQFGLAWVTLGWTIEAVVITLYGLRRGLPYVERAGGVILAICSVNFVVSEAFREMSGYNINLFELKYTAYVVSLLVLLIVYIRSGEFLNKFSNRGKMLYNIKCFTVINTWFYAIYISSRLYSFYFENAVTSVLNHGYNELFETLIFILATIMIGKCFELTNKDKEDKFLNVFNPILYILSALTLMLTVSSKNVLTYPIYGNNSGVEYYGLLVLIAASIITFIVVKDVVKSIVIANGFNFELYPLIINIYLLYIVTSFITYQLGLGDISFLVSLLFLVAAFIYIIMGFKKNYVYLRRFGLGMSLFAVAKLAFYDLTFLEIGWKIIAYFIFGIITILISLFYQNLRSSMENKF
ncbi:MAG TPA: hypothetical protein DCP90_04030 [Clostridiales bacterium]|nr:MAG: hypothetical protein A2Y22_07265 [Clostridiales bacterium GWD2_32_59]HAN09764.1 hypothetical protein [Clostridiales bacterium]